MQFCIDGFFGEKTSDLHECEKYEKEDGKESEQIFPGRLQGEDEDREPVVEPQQLHKLQDADEQDQAANLN